MTRLIPVPPALYERSRFYLFALPPYQVQTKRAGSGSADGSGELYVTQQVTNDDLPSLAQCRGMTDLEAGARLFRDRLEAGAHGILLKERERGETIGFAWASVRENLMEDHDRYHLSLAPNQAYIFDTFLHPSSRGKRLYPLLIEGLRRSLASLTAHSVTEAFVTIDAGNIASLIAHRRIGAVALERIEFSSTFGITRHRLTTDRGHRVMWSGFGTKRLCESLYLSPDPHTKNGRLKDQGEGS